MLQAQWGGGPNGRHCVKNGHFRTFLAVQWLRSCAPIAGGTTSIPGWGTKIPHAAGPKKKKDKEALFLNVKKKLEGTFPQK